MTPGRTRKPKPEPRSCAGSDPRTGLMTSLHGACLTALTSSWFLAYNGSWTQSWYRERRVRRKVEHAKPTSRAALPDRAAPGPGRGCSGKALITDSVSLVETELFGSPVPSRSSLRRLCVLDVHAFLFDCPTGCYVIVNRSLIILGILVPSVIMPPPSFIILFETPLFCSWLA